jgi:hypothetical protein
MKSQTQIGNKKSTANPVLLKGKGSFMLTGNTFDPAPHESELHKIISSQAYLLAEKDGFNGSPIDYWLAAEQEVRQFY